MGHFCCSAAGPHEAQAGLELCVEEYPDLLCCYDKHLEEKRVCFIFWLMVHQEAKSEVEATEEHCLRVCPSGLAQLALLYSPGPPTSSGSWVLPYPPFSKTTPH